MYFGLHSKTFSQMQTVTDRSKSGDLHKATERTRNLNNIFYQTQGAHASNRKFITDTISSKNNITISNDTLDLIST